MTKLFTTHFSAGIPMLALALSLAPGIASAASLQINATKVQNPNVIDIFGSGFGTKAGKVTVGGSAKTVVSWTDSVIAVSFSHTTLSETLPLVVTTSLGKTTSSFITLTPPTVTSAATDRDGTAFVNLVTINGKYSQAHVAPGAKFTVDFSYSTVCSNDCPIALQIGTNVGAPQACFYAEKGTGDSGNLVLTAPSEPGIYYVLLDRNQNYCQEVWDYGTPPLSQSLGSIAVY